MLIGNHSDEYCRILISKKKLKELGLKENDNVVIEKSENKGEAIIKKVKR